MENLRALVNGHDLNVYQRVLAKQEFEKICALLDVVGQSEQLPCDCGVPLAETTLQVYCPKCYKTYKMK